MKILLILLKKTESTRNSVWHYSNRALSKHSCYAWSKDPDSTNVFLVPLMTSDCAYPVKMSCSFLCNLISLHLLWKVWTDICCIYDIIVILFNICLWVLTDSIFWCSGLTNSNYTDMTELYKKYKDQGLSILLNSNLCYQFLSNGGAYPDIILQRELKYYGCLYLI